METNKRSVKLTVRVRPEEKIKLDKTAEDAGQTTASFLRSASLGKRITPVLPDDVRKSISRWSQNLNQLTAKANAGGTATVAEVQALRKEAGELLKAVTEQTGRN